MGTNPVELYREQPGAPEISVGDMNWHVKLLRRMLSYAGIAPPDWMDFSLPVSDHFDNEVLSYLNKFQHDRGLPASCCVSPIIWDALAIAGEAAHPGGNGEVAGPVASRRRIAGRIVEVAKAAEARNIREHGHNRGATVRMIQNHAGLGAGQPWCVAFCWAVVDLAYFLEQEFPPVVSKGAKASCTALVNWASQHGCLVERCSEVAPGDLIVLKRDDGKYFHIGICVSTPDTTGRINTIEGNTNVAGSAEGDGIYDKQRSVERCTFVRL